MFTFMAKIEEQHKLTHESLVSLMNESLVSLISNEQKLIVSIISTNEMQIRLTEFFKA
jgi:PIN domain nuclease of toxin-antitoxin system